MQLNVGKQVSALMRMTIRELRIELDLCSSRGRS
jgi:hypothetical protein